MRCSPSVGLSGCPAHRRDSCNRPPAVENAVCTLCTRRGWLRRANSIHGDRDRVEEGMGHWKMDGIRLVPAPQLALVFTPLRARTGRTGGDWAVANKWTCALLSTARQPPSHSPRPVIPSLPAPPRAVLPPSYDRACVFGCSKRSKIFFQLVLRDCAQRMVDIAVTCRAPCLALPCHCQAVACALSVFFAKGTCAELCAGRTHAGYR